MQIRLTVLAPRGGPSAAAGPASGPSAGTGVRAGSGAGRGAPSGARGRAGSGSRACDVLITAPAGTALAAVASGLATAVAGPDVTGAVVLYAGEERLDAQRRVLGEPPLVDGAVLSLHFPFPGAAEPPGADTSAQLHVVAGPDAGGVHLLHGGRISVGRSAGADVPLDDPDVSRLHCEVTVGDDGLITVADLGSTNGTHLDGRPVGEHPVALPPGALLRLGESTLRLTAGGRAAARVATVPDGEGFLRVPGAEAVAPGAPEDAGHAGDGSGAGADAAGREAARAGAGTAGPSGMGGADAPGARADGSGGQGRAGEQGRSTPYGQGAGAVPGPRGAQGGGHRTPGAVTASGFHADSGAGAGGHRESRSGAAHGPYESHPEDPEAGGRRTSRARGEGSVPTGSTGTAHSASGAGGARAEGTAPGGGYIRESGPAEGGRPGAGAGDPGAGSAYRDDRTHGAGTSHGDRPGAGDTPRRERPGGGDTAREHRRGADSGQPGDRPGPGGSSHGAAHSPGGAAGGRAVDSGGPGEARERDTATGSGAARVPAQYAPAQDTAPYGGAEAAGPAPEESGGAHPGGRAPRKRGIGAWARRLTGAREEPASAEPETAEPPAVAAPVSECWPDPAAILLTALGPGPRLWERGPRHPESLVLRLGTADRDGLTSVPVTVGLREAGSLGLAGPRGRLAGLARSAVAQLAALHSPGDLELVLISADRNRALEERRAEWAWLGWLPHLRPARGQDCRLLLAYDRDQAAARAAELTRRLDDGPLGPGWASADRTAVAEAADRYDGPRTVVVVDGDPGSSALRETTARLAANGRAAGIHLIALAETPAASPLSPVAATYEAACETALPFRECGAVGILSGDVATALRVLRTAGGLPAGHGTPAAVDAVSAAWAERFGRALAPLRVEGSGAGTRPATALPRTARLLDELGLARATPASLMARWASAGDGSGPSETVMVLGTGPGGPLAVDLLAEGPHLLIEGPPGSGRTELLRAVAASLSAGARPDRVGLLLIDGAGGERGEGLAACTELPHVAEHLVAADPVRMRVFAQALGAELKRRAELLGGIPFADWHSRRRSGRLTGPRPPAGSDPRSHADPRSLTDPRSHADPRSLADPSSAGDLESPPSGTLRLRPGARTRTSAATTDRPLPRLVVLADDFDALVAPALGSTGRPAAGSVVRALEAVARDGERLGVHLIATSARPDRTADTELAHGARLRVVLDPPPASAGPDDPLPGRGRLGHPDGRVTPFQGGRVTGRIPRTATLRPTVVPLEWERMGDPPTRRPVRELGNGPTDLALLASALERAASLVDAIPVAPLSPVQS
ncbi:FtsK/SpoIIIE domain-containing protein [Streptomyces sp. CAU 1734]|uniref:FtsK/SpoIIIE domain-containing protein n=1 Tax=Streptomyces sp. CAU 1734 TaxID=3140360 RepID=UPI003261AF74